MSLNKKHGLSAAFDGDKEGADPLAGLEEALPIVRPGDASVAAPFTSRTPSIRSVVHLIRQVLPPSLLLLSWLAPFHACFVPCFLACLLSSLIVRVSIYLSVLPFKFNLDLRAMPLFVCSCVYVCACVSVWAVNCQGRCTLLSALQQQQIMMLECIISAYALSALSLEGARSSERQMMVCTHPLTHSITPAPALSLIHALTHPPAHSFNHSPTYLTHSLDCCLISHRLSGLRLAHHDRLSRFLLHQTRGGNAPRAASALALSSGRLSFHARTSCHPRGLHVVRC